MPKPFDTTIPVDQGWSMYFGSSIKDVAKKLIAQDPEYFENEGKKMSLQLFHQMSERVPAYIDFLKSHNINPKSIKTYNDFVQIPCIDKLNYVKRYPLADLCWDGKLTSPIISASAGSSGQVTYWPRSDNIEIETTYLYELFLNNIYEIDKYHTLLINGFSMGIYIGGTFTLNCCMRISQKNYPLTIMTPGINQDEILGIVEKLSNEFQQIILCGYPPFVRDIIDAGIKRGIDWTKLKLKFYFASESFSEELRAYIYERAGVKEKDYYTSSLNLYGTADAAIAGHEMPLSIYVRRLFSADDKKCMEFFGKSYVPSINQYYPFLKYFEVIDGEIVFSTAHTEIPLCRYNIHDQGGILSFNQMLELCQSFGHGPKDIEKSISSKLLWHLPFVYLYGRSDFTITLYGLNIYPENVKAALESIELSPLASGKFVMEAAQRENDQSQYLLIHIELQPDVIATNNLADTFRQMIVKTLRQKNSEYNFLYQSINKKAEPEIDLRTKGDTEYFPAVTKQKWVKK